MNKKIRVRDFKNVDHFCLPVISPSRTWLDDISDWGGEDVNTLARKAQDRPLWETTIKKPREVHN